MKVTERIHALRIPFKIPVTPDRTIDREVWVYLLLGKSITLVDTGVWGARASIRAYLETQQRSSGEIAQMILTHSHPDHIGAAQGLQKETGCTVWAHESERDWIENTELQFRERPVPGFYTLVEGPVKVAHLLSDGDELNLDPEIPCRVVHTPGHSRGSLSLFLPKERTLISGDAIPVPGDLPVYEDITECVWSLRKLLAIGGVELLLSSWEAPLEGLVKVESRIREGLAWLHQIHEAVTRSDEEVKRPPMDLCRHVSSQLGLPPFAVNPLVAQAFSSSLVTGARGLFSL